jgi:hypothetical protein
MNTYGTPSQVRFLPEYLDEEHTQIFNPRKTIIVTSGPIGAGKDQAGILARKDLWYNYGLVGIEIDPDKEFKKEWNPIHGNPMDHFAENRIRARDKFIHALQNASGEVPIYQSGGATLHGPSGRGELVMTAFQLGFHVLHIFIDTPWDICHDRNEQRREQGKRYTPSEEFWRCAEQVERNYNLLGRELRGDGGRFPEGEIYNTSLRFCYLKEGKFKLIWPDGTVRIVNNNFTWETKDNPFLTEWK